MAIPAALPPLYDAWIRDCLGGTIPAETNATCDTCAMVVPEGSGEPGFNPDTKCCTFVPTLWNFLIGRVLLDDDPTAARGRATAEARIDRGVGVTPLGLRRSRAYDLLYETGGTASFGHSRSMVCPHYLPGGLCGVWRNRESTCMTWFCKYVRGEVGSAFWSHLHQMLREAEEAVSVWCLLELGLGSDALAFLYRPYRDRKGPKLTASDIDNEPNAADVAAMWGSWLGREREFYTSCARLVDPLSWDDVLRIGGARLNVYTQLTRDAYARLMSDGIPERPEQALIQITPRAGGRVRLATYSTGDVLEVPAIVAKVLPYFDGRAVAETLEDIRQQERVNIHPDLVRKLTDFGVLREAVKR